MDDIKIPQSLTLFDCEVTATGYRFNDESTDKVLPELLKIFNTPEGKELTARVQRLRCLSLGVTDVMFAYGLLTVLQEFLKVKSIYPNFVLLVLGRHGDFKTMLSRTFFCTADLKRQEIKFYQLKNSREFSGILQDAMNLPVLVDDVIPIMGYAKKRNYADIFDWVTRGGDRRLRQGGVIITAEKIPDDVVASAFDRIFEIDIPRLSSQDKKNWYQMISSVSSSDLNCIYLSFAKKLLEAGDELMTDISSYLDSFEVNTKIGHETRICDHFQCLELANYLFDKYMLNEESSSFDHILSSALMQQDRILKMDQELEVVDYARLVYEALFVGEGKPAVKTNRMEYGDLIGRNIGNRQIILLENNFIYVLPEVLYELLAKKLGHSVDSKKVIDALKRSEVLVTNEGGNTVTNVRPKRHYKIYRPKLSQYYSKVGNSEHEQLTVDVIRKGGARK